MPHALPSHAVFSEMGLQRSESFEHLFAFSMLQDSPLPQSPQWSTLPQPSTVSPQSAPWSAHVLARQVLLFCPESVVMMGT